MAAMHTDWIFRASLGLGLIVGLLLGGCDASGPRSTGSGEGTGPVVAASAIPPPASAGAVGADRGDGGAVVARYGPEVLTEAELVTELERLPARSRSVMNDEGRRRFVENYVLNELLFAEGKSRGFGDDPEVQRQVDDLRKRLVVQKVVRELQDIPPTTDAEVKAQYDAHPERYSTTTIRVRHILVKDEAQAKEIRAQVVAKPESFPDVAKERSVDKASARKGGDLGFFGHGRMVPEFEEVAFALKTPNEISEVVRTQYGFHIIQLQERREGEPKPFDQVKEQIRAVMRNKMLRERTESHYAQLKEKANLQIDDAAAQRAAQKIPESSPGTAMDGFHGSGH
jgi:peptidyl-prolyl cis-trans isomerase C